MLKTKNVDDFETGEKICLFKKKGVLPIACGFLEFFDEKDDKVYINVDKRSVKLTKHLYDFVRASVLDEAGLEGQSERVRQQFTQLSGIMKHESKT